MRCKARAHPVAGGAVRGISTLGLTVPNRHNGVSFRIPAVPCVSSCTQSPGSSCPLGSSRVLLVPELRDTAVTSPRRLKASGKPSRRPDLSHPADRLPHARAFELQRTQIDWVNVIQVGSTQLVAGPQPPAVRRMATSQ